MAKTSLRALYLRILLETSRCTGFLESFLCVAVRRKGSDLRASVMQDVRADVLEFQRKTSNFASATASKLAAKCRIHYPSKSIWKFDFAVTASDAVNSACFWTTVFGRFVLLTFFSPLFFKFSTFCFVFVDFGFFGCFWPFIINQLPCDRDGGFFWLFLTIDD